MDGGRRVGARARCARALRAGTHDLPVLHRTKSVLPAAAQRSAFPAHPVHAETRRADGDTRGRMKRGFLGKIIAAAAMTVALPVAAAEPIRIGAVLPFSGGVE